MKRACLNNINPYGKNHAGSFRSFCARWIRMKTKMVSVLLLGWLSFTACEKDGSLYKVFGLDSSELLSSETEVVLTKATASSSVLALTWSKSDLTVNNDSVKLPDNVPLQIIEISGSEDFDHYTTLTPQTNTYSFLGAALNTLGKNLGFTVGVSTPMYFRVKTAYGDNTEVHYSNVVNVQVTCYSIDMSIGYILDSKQADTGFKLYAPNSDGEYRGFTGSGAWFNWFMLEGDGTVWGNLPVDGNPFVLSSESTAWNFWYPGQSGCYYTTLSTTSEEWTATYIPALTVSGAVEASMTFDKANVKWYVSFTTTTDNATVKVSSSNASLYNKTTGTTDASAVARTLGFIPHSDSTLTIDWNSASAGDITIAKAGDYTLTFYLSNPKAWTYQIKSGKTVVVEPLSKYLYLPGVDDGTSGSWTFNNYLRLVSEDDSTFAGAVAVNSLWGYEMTLTSGEWSNVYQMGSSEGTLKFKSGTNITAPAAGLYLIQADLHNLTYSHTAINGLSYAGFNDDWSLVAMDATSVSGVFAKSVTLNTASSWGGKLYLNGGWDYFYGGSGGSLDFKGTGITDDATLAAGTYDLVADIRNSGSYVFLGNEVYIGGLNDVWDFTSCVLTRTSAGVYKGTATITAASSWGIKIYLDQTWNRYYGGTFNSISYLGANITDDQSLAAGTYNVTVDFINKKCSFVVAKKK